MNSEMASVISRPYQVSGTSSGGPNGVSRPGTKFAINWMAAISRTPTIASSRSSCLVGSALAFRAYGPASFEENGMLSATAMTCSASAICPMNMIENST